MLTGPLHAPDHDGGILTVPPLEQAPALVQQNRARLNRHDRSLLDTPLPRLQQQARKEVVALARTYLSDRDEPIPAPATGPVFLSGHQPELFHPGVWIKNFALAGLANRLGGTAINLIVDSDNLKTPSLRVPVRSPKSQRPTWVAIPFDRPTPEMPFEERAIVDFDFFRSFPRRVQDALAVWKFEPILPSFWSMVCEEAGRSFNPLIGEIFAAARRSLERAWGCHNLEVPLSLVCQTPSFATFAVHLLTHIERFQGVYNSAIQGYRVRHDLRSRNHPVPELVRADDWFETPFWGWRAHQRRGRLFIRPLPDRTELRAGEDVWPTLPPLSDPEAVRSAWLSLERQGCKVRSRALTTTLFARLILGDLFLHGIGGAKYDELTDELLERFFEVEAPAYGTVSATRWLPLPTFPATPAKQHELARALRDLRWNPQRHLSPEALANPAVQSLLAQKQEWVERQPPDRIGRRERFRRLQDLTARFRPFIATQESALRERLATVERELEANAVLRSREYSFALFPEALLRPFLTQLL